MDQRDLTTNIKNEEDRQVARVLTMLIYASWGMFLFVSITGILADDRRLIVVTLLGCVALILPMVLLKRRKLRASSLLSTLIILGTVTSLATIGQGIRDLAVITFPILFIFTGLTLDRKLFGLCVGLALAAIGWLSLGETFGWFTPVPFIGGNWFYLIEVIVILLIAALAVDLLASNLRRGLEQAQTEIAQRKQTEQTLYMLSSRQEALLTSIPDIIMEVDKNKVYTWANHAGMEFFGDGVIGREAAFFFEGDQTTYTDITPLLEGSEEIIYIESWQRRKDGEKRLLAWWCRVMKDSEGNVTGALSTARDISERKRNELIKDAIFKITQASITGEKIDDLYHSIHSILSELISVENFYIALFDPLKGSMTFPYYVDQFDEAPSAPTPVQGLTGYVIRSGLPLLAPREIYEQLVKQGEVDVVGKDGVDWMGVPLKVEGRTIGVMAVQSYTEGIRFDQADLNLLEFVSSQVAQVIERKHLEEEIRSLSVTDELTGLYNRRGFNLLAEQEIKLARRLKKSVLLYFCDVDDLKVVNDTQGHDQGDLALKEISVILKETFRETDIPARLGGDEFVVLAVDASIETAELLTDRIRARLEKRNQQEGRLHQLSLSLGIAQYDPEAPSTLNELIAEADGQMYKQKQARKENR